MKIFCDASPNEKLGWEIINLIMILVKERQINSILYKNS